MTERPNILVVCGRNKRRSRTAEYLFKNDNRFNIRSVGLSPKSDRRINEKDISWSDLVFVMEDQQNARIRGTYRNLEIPPIYVLHIADEYEYCDPELIDLLTQRINLTLEIEWK